MTTYYRAYINKTPIYQGNNINYGLVKYNNTIKEVTLDYTGAYYNLARDISIAAGTTAYLVWVEYTDTSINSTPNNSVSFINLSLTKRPAEELANMIDNMAMYNYLKPITYKTPVNGVSSTITTANDNFPTTDLYSWVSQKNNIVTTNPASYQTVNEQLMQTSTTISTKPAINIKLSDDQVLSYKTFPWVNSNCAQYFSTPIMNQSGYTVDSVPNGYSFPNTTGQPITHVTKVILRVPSVPDAVVITRAATLDQNQVTIYFNEPWEAGAPINTYTITSSPENITTTVSIASVRDSGNSITVTGLTNGITYTFTIKVANYLGSSAVSNTSSGVKPIGLATAPFIGTATAGEAKATITFSAPVSDGGVPITSYTVTSSPDNITATGSSTSIIVTGLTNGTSYTFTVVANNAYGSGLVSNASNSAIPRGKPSAPSITSVTPDNLSAIIAFTPPTDDGTSLITSYTVKSSPDNITATGAASSPITISGLTNGTPYTFTLTATNAVGSGPASSSSNSVVPRGKPFAPTIGTATAYNGYAVVSFTPPTNNNGSRITSYVVNANGAPATGTSTSSPITVTDLTNNVAYSFSVAAVNIAGTGTFSVGSNYVVPVVS